MIGDKKILVMILARSGSTSVKDKNIADLNGKPVLWYSINEAQKSKYADAICVSTDSPVYAQVAKDAGLEVPFLRVAEHSTKDSTAAAASRWSTLAYEQYSGEKYDYIVDFMCTNPFKTAEDLDACIEKLHDTGADTVVAVVRVWDGHPARVKQIIDDEIQDWPGCHEVLESLRQQLTPPAYSRCGSVYAMRRHVLIDEGNRRGKVSRPYIMPPERVVNIDEPKDLMTARAMMQLRSEATPRSSLGMKILVLSKCDDLPGVSDKLSSIGACDFRPGLAQKDLPSLVHDYDAIFAPTHLSFSRTLLQKRADSRLRIICTPSVGIDHIDVESAKEFGIEVISLQKQYEFLKNISSPAELAFSFMLNLARRVVPATEHVKEGGWKATPFTGVELKGSTVAVIGVGSVGTMFMRYCLAFNMRVVCYDPYKTIHDPNVTQVAYLDHALANADFVSIHVSATDETKKMFSTPQFACMKKSAYLINTARGCIVDQEALIDALEKKVISGAGLDVVENEQDLDSKPSSHRLLIEYASANENLLVTPHIGGSTTAARTRRAQHAADLLYQWASVQQRGPKSERGRNTK